MSTYTIQGETLTDIADAIRSKTGGSALIATEDMASEIESISGGGSQTKLKVADWDFTSSLIDSVQGLEATLTEATRDSDGVHITANSHQILLPAWLYAPSMTYEIELANVEANFMDAHGIILGFLTENGQNGGFIWHNQTNKFAIWDNVGGWQDSTIEDKSYLNGDCIIKIRIDTEARWFVYKNDVLMFELPKAINQKNRTTNVFAIGRTMGTTTTFFNMDVKAIRAYYEFD